MNQNYNVKDLNSLLTHLTHIRDSLGNIPAYLQIDLKNKWEVRLCIEDGKSIKIVAGSHL